MPIAATADPTPWLCTHRSVGPRFRHPPSPTVSRLPRRHETAESRVIKTYKTQLGEVSESSTARKRAFGSQASFVRAYTKQPSFPVSVL